MYTETQQREREREFRIQGFGNGAGRRTYWGSSCVSECKTGLQIRVTFQ